MKTIDLSLFLRETLGAEENSQVGFAFGHAGNRVSLTLSEFGHMLRSNPELLNNNAWFNAALLDGRGSKVANCVSTKSISIDVDYGNKGHAKPSKFPDAASALNHILSLPVQPSAIWDSGHGLQAAYLLDRPLYFSSGDIEPFEEAKRRLYALACSDSTQSHEHLFRLPGTANDKRKKFPDCETVMGTIVRPLDISVKYSLDEIIAALPPVSSKVRQKAPAACGQHSILSPPDAEFGEITSPEELGIPDKLQELLDKVHPRGTRSESFHRAVLGLYELGASLDCIREVVSRNPSFADKYEGRLDEEIVRCVSKKRPDGFTPLKPDGHIVDLSLEADE